MGSGQCECARVLLVRCECVRVSLVHSRLMLSSYHSCAHPSCYLQIAGDSIPHRDTLIKAGLVPVIATTMELSFPEPSLREVAAEGEEEGANPDKANKSVSMLRNATWTLSNLCRGEPAPALEGIIGCFGVLEQVGEHVPVSMLLGLVAQFLARRHTLYPHLATLVPTLCHTCTRKILASEVGVHTSIGPQIRTASLPAPHDMKDCSACSKSLGQDAFSKTQWGKGASRRCKECTGQGKTRQGQGDRPRGVDQEVLNDALWAVNYITGTVHRRLRGLGELVHRYSRRSTPLLSP
jgi:hypothetical protein